MSPLRAAVAAALLLGVPLVAGVAFGVPSVPALADSASTTEQPSDSLVENQTPTPSAADRQTPSATATEASTRSDDPDAGAGSESDATEGSQESTSTPQDETATTTEKVTDSPTDTEQATATPTDRPVSTDEGETDATTETETSTQTPRETESPTATPTDATDGGADDGARQCTVDRDGHDKPALPDPVSPPSDAQSIESGATISGSVGPDETRWYAVDVEKGESLSVITEGSPESLSLAIFGPDGSPVDALDTRTPDRTAFGATADRSGTYYVRVTAGDGYGGFYRLTAETAGPDQFDPNDSMRRALPVANGSSTDATLAEGEVDWYAIKLDAGDALSANVTVNGHALGRDVRVDVYGPDGSHVGQGGETRFDPSTGTNRAYATATVPEAGTYYVRVHCAALDGHAPYTLDVNTSSS